MENKYGQHQDGADIRYCQNQGGTAAGHYSNYENNCADGYIYDNLEEYVQSKSGFSPREYRQEFPPGGYAGTAAEVHNGHYEILCEFEEQCECYCYRCDSNNRKKYQGKDYGGTYVHMAPVGENSEKDYRAGK